MGRKRAVSLPARIGEMEPSERPEADLIPAISTGRKGVASAAASTLSRSGEKRGSFSHLKIRFAFIAYRRATRATNTPGVNACAQTKRFSASGQNRFFRPFFPTHDTPQDVHYQWWTLSGLANEKQTTNTRRLLLRCHLGVKKAQARLRARVQNL